MHESEDSNLSSSAESQKSPLTCSEHTVVLIVGHNIWEWIFLVICVLNVVVLLVSSGVTVETCFREKNLQSPTFLFEVVIWATSGTSLIFAIYGIFAEQQFDIYLHLAFMLLAITCSFVNNFNVKGSLKPTEECFVLRLACNIACCIFWTCSFFFGRHATTVPDWPEFRIIGVSDPLAAMYKQVCYFLCILKFDSLNLVFIAIYSIKLESVGNNMKNDLVLLMIVVTYSIISWVCGKIAIHKEDNYIVFGFVLLTIAYPGFVVYQCYRLLQNPRVPNDKIMSYTAVAFNIFVIITKVYLLNQLIKTIRTFGYGLNTRSFRDLVSRDSFNIISRSRSALLY